jgi:hypothetical protein
MSLQRSLYAVARRGVRQLGGHSHATESHGHGSKSPLAEAYDNGKPYVFNGEFAGKVGCARAVARHTLVLDLTPFPHLQHDSHEDESWKGPTYLCIAGCVFLAGASFFRKSTSPYDWARDEAEERLRRRDAGLPVEYGVNYAGVRYMKERGVVSNEEAERLESGVVARVR